MSVNRRDFLRVGGAVTLALGIFPGVKLVTDKSAKANQSGSNAKWALAIDLNLCWEQQQKGCNSCITACHKAHNVPYINDPKEEIKWIWAAPFAAVFPEQEHELLDDNLKGSSALALCNHCDNAPCVRVCPTKATFQTKTGITVMDYHRCIGCRYCMAACPYGARSFNFRDPRLYSNNFNMEFPTREKGVVEKCNFCAEKLDIGERPLCAEACPHGALFFGDLNDNQSEIRKVLKERFSIQRKPELGTKPKVYYLP